MITHLKHTKTGRIFIATPALLERGDMQPVYDLEVKEPKTAKQPDEQAQAAGESEESTLVADQTGDTDESTTGDDENESSSDDEQSGGLDFDELTKAQIVQIGADYGLELSVNSRKDELVAAVQAVMAGE